MKATQPCKVAFDNVTVLHVQPLQIRAEKASIVAAEITLAKAHSHVLMLTVCRENAYVFLRRTKSDS